MRNLKNACWLKKHSRPVSFLTLPCVTCWRCSSRCKHMGGCQNGPFLGTLNIRCRIIIGTQKGTIILTTSHVNPKASGLLQKSPAAAPCRQMQEVANAFRNHLPSYRSMLALDRMTIYGFLRTLWYIRSCQDLAALRFRL